MDKQRLLELAGVELDEGVTIVNDQLRTVLVQAIDKVMDLVDLEDGGESLGIAINKIVSDAIKEFEKGN